MHNNRKQLVVNDFIKQFLMPNERFYKNTHTEFVYLLETIDRIFSRFLDWQTKLDSRMLKAAFSANDFDFQEVKGSFHMIDGRNIPLLYVNVLVKEIVPLRSSLADLSPQANEDTRRAYELLLQRLQAFKESQKLV